MGIHNARENETFYDPENDYAMGRQLLDVPVSEQKWIIDGIPKLALTTFSGPHDVERRRFLLEWAYNAGICPVLPWRGREVECQNFIYYVTAQVVEARRTLDGITSSPDGISIMLCSIEEMLTYGDHLVEKFLWMDQSPWVIIDNLDTILSWIGPHPQDGHCFVKHLHRLAQRATVLLVLNQHHPEVEASAAVEMSYIDGNLQCQRTSIPGLCVPKK